MNINNKLFLWYLTMSGRFRGCSVTPFVMKYKKNLGNIRKQEGIFCKHLISRENSVLWSLKTNNWYFFNIMNKAIFPNVHPKQIIFFKNDKYILSGFWQAYIEKYHPVNQNMTLWGEGALPNEPQSFIFWRTGWYFTIYACQKPHKIYFLVQ